jgi:acetyltransferase-like isoleucine patch superfamily enzyme
MFSKLRLICKLDLCRFIYLNFLCGAVARDKGTYILPFRGAKIEIRKGAKLIIHQNIYICANKIKGSRQEAYLQLYERSIIEISGETTLNYGAMVQAHKNAYIQIGKSHLNSWATIIADKQIKIGNDVLISRDVAIFDSDFHLVLNESGERTNNPSPVIIEDHVWIGVKSTILRGVHIGKGAVIGANSLVTTNVPDKALISTAPSRAYGYIEWRA